MKILKMNTNEYAHSELLQTSKMERFDKKVNA